MRTDKIRTSVRAYRICKGKTTVATEFPTSPMQFLKYRLANPGKGESMIYARHMESHKATLHKLWAGTDRLQERKRPGKVTLLTVRIGYGQQADQPKT